MAIDFSTKDEVRRLAVAFRKEHDALDWSVSVDDLITLRGLSQASYSPWGVGARIKTLLSGVTKKIKALLSLQEQVILLATDLHGARHAFAKGHELGHAVLPWHRDILYACDEHDLSQKTREQMEYEANAFASEVLLPGPLLQQIYQTHPTTMHTVLHLRQLTGASIESSAIAYATNHPRRCVLIILHEEKEADGSTKLVLRGKAVSEPASKAAVSTLTRDQKFGLGHVIFTKSRKPHVVENCQLQLTENPSKRFEVTIFNTGYKVLALITDE